jgi:hypothetical protein
MRCTRSAALAAAALLLTACGRSEPANNPAATPAASPSWNVSIQPMQIPVGTHSVEPQMATSSRGAILSWLESSNNTATLKFAERTGGAWGSARTAASGANWFVSWADAPAVMRLGDGTLLAHWYLNTNVQQEGYDLLMSYSRDEGKTWAKPFMPHHDRTQTQHGFASLFEQPGKGVGMVWLDARDYELAKDDPEGGAIMMRYASFDPQWKQTADDAVNLRVCECCQTSVAMTADGVIAAFRDRTDNEIRDIHVTRLENGKWTAPVAVHQDNWEVDSCPVNGPAVSARGKDVAVAWFTARDNQGHAYAAFSNDSGRTWGTPIRLDDGRSVGHVDIELLDDGSAVTTWVEFADQRNRFRMRRVEASGARSGAIDLAGGGEGRVSGYPRMARSGDELLFAWTESTGAEDEEGAQQVKGAVARLPK